MKTTGLRGADLQVAPISTLNGEKFRVRGTLVEVRVGHYPGGRLAIQLVVAHDQAKVDARRVADSMALLQGKKPKEPLPVGPYPGELWATLTVNMVDSLIEDGEIHVKAWEENKDSAAAALATGLFADTFKRVSAGWCAAQVWRVLL